jgi:acyl dehydratase
MSRETIEVSSPYFEDLEIGQSFDDAPAVTVTPGHAAVHQAVFGDRLRLPLDADLCRRVTGSDNPLVHPSLVCNIAIGQTTMPSGRVLGNLFYRGLVLKRPVYIGDTLRTRTQIVALRQNKPRDERPATGMAVFEMHVENQQGQTVLHFWRCPMLPCRDPGVETGHADSFDDIAPELEADQVKAAVPAHWRFDTFRERNPGAHFEDISAGAHYRVDGRDTVTCAPEIARMTLNVAAAHTYAAGSSYGKRLVYGGHTISTATALVTRALPNLVTLVAWRSCDHTAPVFEGDMLGCEFTVDSVDALEGGGGLVGLHVLVDAERGEDAPDGESTRVLDWRAIGVMA